VIRFRTRLRDRQGSALVLLVVAMLGILSMMALAIDMGMLRTAHGEAQRAADAAALAGASAFMEMGADAAALAAPTRAKDFAILNTVQGKAFAADEVVVTVDKAKRTVRVRVRKPAVPTWFARMFGVSSAPVSARAAAHAVRAPTSRCMKPFVPPDLWAEQDDDDNGNRVWDPGEKWEFEPEKGDFYNPGGPGGTPDKPETGYGSGYRGTDNDRGRKLMLTESALNGFANLWAMPETELGDDEKGGNALRQNINTCNSTPIKLGSTYALLSGMKTGPILQGVTDLVLRDPTARWDEASGEVVGSLYADWMKSPRVIRVPLHDPAELTSKKESVVFRKFAWVFLEPPGGPADPIVARFVEVVRVLQLVE
jgi:hypothetical protein